MSSFRSPLGRVRGLGTARSGVRHWWQQKVTAIANLFLVLWFLVSVAMLAGADHAAIIWWLSDPLTATLLVALVLSTFWHLRLGLQTIVEDYVHDEAMKLGALVLITLGCAGLAVFAIISLFKISFGA